MSCRIVPAWVFSLVLFPLSGILGAADEAPRVSIAARSLGVTGGKVDAPGFAAALKERSWQAEPTKPGPSWSSPPPRLAPDQYVSVVTLALGEQAEAYALQFAGPGGALSKAVHLSYRQTWLAASVRYAWIVPTKNLADLYHATVTRREETKRALLMVKVSEWASESQEEGLEGMLAANLDNLQALPHRKAAPILSVMAWWAAWSNGWQPTASETGAKAHLEVRMGYKQCDLRLHLTTSTGTQRVVKRNIPEEWVQATLSRMFWLLRQGGRVHDVGRVATAPVSLLSASPITYAVQCNGTLLGFDPVRGKQMFPPPIVPGQAKVKAPPPMRYVRQKGKVYRISSGVALVNPQTGEEVALAPEGAAQGWMFSASGNRDVVLAAGWSVKRFRSGKRVWERQWPCAISAGPVVDGKQVLLGTAGGAVQALALKDGALEWSAELPGGAVGPVAVDGTLALVFCTEDEYLYAFDRAGGNVRWKVGIGDMLAREPMFYGNQVLVVSKANRLLLVNAADGSIVAERSWPSWFVAVDRVPFEGASLVVCTDVDDRVSFLSATTLEVRQQLVLPAAPSGGLLAGAEIPLTWAPGVDALGEARDVKRGPALIVSDRDGFVYLLSVPEGN